MTSLALAPVVSHRGAVHSAGILDGLLRGQARNGTRNPRIALFIPTLGAGGAERITLTLACGFRRLGLSVDLVVASSQGELRAAIPRGVRLVDLAMDWHVDNIQPMVAYLRRARPLALVSSLTEANCLAIQARAAAGVDTRLAVVEHSTLSRIARSLPADAGRKLPILIRRHYPQADAIIAVSAGVADDLALTTGLPRQRIDVVYNPVPAQEIRRQSTLSVRHPWLAAGQPPLVLAVGRLAPAKDFATLVQAFARLRRVRPARLVILGEGAQRAPLEHLAVSLGLQRDVYMPGFVANPFAWMKRAGTLALSSRWEGLPTVLVEALACGVPIVSTDCPSGPAEILENGKWGRLVPPGNEQALAAAIGESLQQALPTARLGFVRAGFFSLERALCEYGRRLGLGRLVREQIHRLDFDAQAAGGALA